MRCKFISFLNFPLDRGGECARAAALAALFIAVGGCSNFDPKRFAPPGIIKYEEIAGDQPPDPEIQRIIEAQTESGSGEFPDLSETPSAVVRPPLSDTGTELLSNDLVAAGDALTRAVAADRQASEDERAQIEALEATREALGTEIDRDSELALAERRNPPPQIKPAVRE